MNNRLISSGLIPIEMSEMNREDAKQMDTAIGVVLSEMPNTIIHVKQVIDEVNSLLRSLKTIKIGFNIGGEIEKLSSDYDKFAQDIITSSSFYELEIVNLINLFDRQNSSTGPTVDNNYFNHLPFLGTLLFTFLSYTGDGNPFNDPANYILDAAGNYMDRNDFNACIGNMAYNAGELFAKRLGLNNAIGQGSIAFGALIMVESLHDLIFVNTDSRQNEITLVRAFGDGVKLFGGNVVADVAATHVAPAVSTWVATKLAGFAGAKFVGFAGVAAGSFVGMGLVVLGEVVLDYVVDPIVDNITGEAYIAGTSIPRNGGLTSLYSDYVRSMNNSIYNCENTLSLYGITVSSEYCHAMVQLDPVNTLLGLESGKNLANSDSVSVLEDYLNRLKLIPKDSSNFKEQVDYITLTATGLEFGYGSIKTIMDLGFDPYTYAMNN